MTLPGEPGLNTVTKNDADYKMMHPAFINSASKEAYPPTIRAPEILCLGVLKVFCVICKMRHLTLKFNI